MKRVITKTQGHYARIADIYRSLRTTDSEPVLYVKEIIRDREEITAADVGTGAGRYAATEGNFNRARVAKEFL